MAMYYGDPTNKAKKIVLAGAPGPQGPAGPAGPPASLQTVKTTTSWAKKSTSAGTQYWEQPVTVPGLTAQAQVDIALDADGLNRLLTDGVSALWAENNMGNLTVKTLEAAPTAALTLYLTITEVTV